MDDNVFTMIRGAKADNDTNSLPNHFYVLEDHDGNVYETQGFLIFTSQHIAVMRDLGKGQGAIPVLVMPLENLRVAELVDDNEYLYAEEDAGEGDFVAV